MRWQGIEESEDDCAEHRRGRERSLQCSCRVVLVSVKYKAGSLSKVGLIGGIQGSRRHALCHDLGRGCDKHFLHVGCWHYYYTLAFIRCVMWGEGRE